MFVVIKYNNMIFSVLCFLQPSPLYLYTFVYMLFCGYLYKQVGVAKKKPDSLVGFSIKYDYK